MKEESSFSKGFSGACGCMLAVIAVIFFIIVGLAVISAWVRPE